MGDVNLCEKCEYLVQQKQWPLYELENPGQQVHQKTIYLTQQVHQKTTMEFLFFFYNIIAFSNIKMGALHPSNRRGIITFLGLSNRFQRYATGSCGCRNLLYCGRLAALPFAAFILRTPEYSGAFSYVYSTDFASCMQATGVLIGPFSQCRWLEGRHKMTQEEFWTKMCCPVFLDPFKTSSALLAFSQTKEPWL